MPGPIVHLGAVVLCSHAGNAIPVTPNPRVLVSGQPVVAVGSPYVIAGCALTSSGGPFCATGQWVVGSTRVLSNGLPLALAAGASVCVATGSPMLAVTTQVRVVAT